MASSITLRVGNLTSTITFAKTDAQIAEILRWWIQDWASLPPEGSTQQQQNQHNLDQAAARIVATVRQEAARVRLRELRAAQANLEDQASADTQL
jgi:hypothetical protein